MNRSRLATWLYVGALGIGAGACGNNDNKVVDAKVADAKAIDAPTDAPSVSFNSLEGGEVRFEYLTFEAGNASGPGPRVRGTAFFFKGDTVYHQFPAIPGCTDYTPMPYTQWPIAQEANRQYMDVGQVIIAADGAGPPSQFMPTAGALNGFDALGRQYTGPWHFQSTNMVGANYITPDTNYDVILTGSAEWPAQLYKDVLYMPPAFDLVSPPACTVAPCAPIPLVAHTDLEIDYTVPANLNILPGARVDTLVAFLNSAAQQPTVLCIEEGNNLTGKITIPAAYVDIARAALPSGTSKLLRQHVVHQIRELTNGVTHENKRIDFLAVWCYNYPYTAP